jgi:hypothetical protein
MPSNSEIAREIACGSIGCDEHEEHEPECGPLSRAITAALDAKDRANLHIPSNQEQPIGGKPASSGNVIFTQPGDGMQRDIKSCTGQSLDLSHLEAVHDAIAAGNYMEAWDALHRGVTSCPRCDEIDFGEEAP